MIGGVGPDDQFTGHEWVQVAAGFSAAKNKFARSLRPEFDRGHPAPISIQVVAVFYPVMLAKSGALAGNQLDGVAVQLETVGDIRGGKLQNHGIAPVYDDTRWRVGEPVGVNGMCRVVAVIGSWAMPSGINSASSRLNRIRKKAFFLLIFQAPGAGVFSLTIRDPSM